MTLTQAYIFLMIAIILEITATGSLKATEGFTKWIPSLISVIAISGCMFLMSHAMKNFTSWHHLCNLVWRWYSSDNFSRNH